MNDPAISPPASSQAEACTTNGFHPALRIVWLVSQHYHFTPTELFGSKRVHAELAWARHVARFLASEFTGEGPSFLGRYFRCDHSTILNSIKAVRDQMDCNRAALLGVENVRAIIKAELGKEVA